MFSSNKSIEKMTEHTLTLIIDKYKVNKQIIMGMEIDSLIVTTKLFQSLFHTHTYLTR